MELLSSPHAAVYLSASLYYQVVHTLTRLVPPPLDDTPEALLTRNHAGIAKVAALLPANAIGADFAPSLASSPARCIAARAQAEDLLRLLRQHVGYIEMLIRLNTQYGSVVRTSLSVHARLMRVQALRQKRVPIGAANQDAWALHMAERSMLEVAGPDARSQRAASHKAARAGSPETARATSPETAPAADVAQTTEKNILENGSNSQGVGFETWLSALSPDLGNERTLESQLFEAALASGMAQSLRPGASCS